MDIIESDTASRIYDGIYFQNSGAEGLTTQAAERRPMLEFHQSTIAWAAA
jgi:hypothetical protein